ncbi:MAG: TIGR04282 family arsenosugar biosynthesis glycosyltransferase [Phaeodactylibacter sp.]|nr:TIGR04282 family arsenosugar biosynthesis glycosyltransferase [Phaeodactylibacter sp.]MCB9275394.1 TIGR04282 family arsenosugar biosynthesis glycosyltransferase [Lewinellaceae bacterium]
MHLNTGHRALIIFIRTPELGKVKARLAQTVGEKQALRIYKALLAHTREVALAVQALRLLFYSGPSPQENDWPSELFIKYPQQGEGLGQRMLHAFEIALRQANEAVIVGSDIPGLSAAIIEQAFDQLTEHDFSIGPARDGGYYLLGMKALQPALFRDMPWSTSRVFSETVSIIEKMGRTYALAPECSDVDVAEDWEREGWDV